MSTIASNSKKTLLRQVVSIVIQLMSMSMIARGLGVEGNGQYALAVLLPTSLVTILSFGISPANIYFVGTKKYTEKTIYTTTVLLGIFIALFGFIIGYIFVGRYGETVFPNISSGVLLLSLYGFPFSLLFTLEISFLQAKEDFTKFNTVSILKPIFFLFMILILYWFQRLTLENVLWVLLINSMVLFVIVTYFVITSGYSFSLRAYSWNYLGNSLSYGLRTHLSNLISFVNYRADMFLLNLLATTRSVGIYSVAVHIGERLWIFSQALSTVLFPRLVALNHDDAQRIALITRSFRIVIILTVLASVVLTLLGYYGILLLFGRDFLEAYSAVLFLIPGIVLGAGSRILANAIAAKGNPEYNMYTSVLAMIVNIVLNIFFIPKFGFIGAAVATSVAYAFNTFLRIMLIQKLEKLFRINDLYIRMDDFYFIYNKAVVFTKGKA